MLQLLLPLHLQIEPYNSMYNNRIETVTLID